MGEILRSSIRMAAMQLASDAEICKMCRLKPEQLERYRGMIEAARAEAMVMLKHERAKRKVQSTRKDGS